MYMRLQSPVKLPVLIIARVLVLLGWMTEFCNGLYWSEVTENALSIQETDNSIQVRAGPQYYYDVSACVALHCVVLHCIALCCIAVHSMIVNT